jgi:hypothetical protein
MTTDDLTAEKMLHRLPSLKLGSPHNKIRAPKEIDLCPDFGYDDRPGHNDANL